MAYGGKFGFYFCLSCVVYLIFPVLPNAIAKMYQGKVTDSFFTSLPVSFFLHCTICVLISYLIMQIYNVTKNIVFKIVLIVTIVIIAIPVQVMNGIISKEQRADYDRLVNIEKLFDTKSMANMNHAKIYSKDIFETRNLLGIHDSYWNDFASFKDLDLTFTRDINEEFDFQIYMVDNKYFTLIGKEEIVVLSYNKLPEKIKIKFDDNIYNLVDNNFWIYDHGFFCYRYVKQEDGAYMQIMDSFAGFEGEQKGVGSTLTSANILYGIYGDGWVAQEASFEIYTNEEGLLRFKGYYPDVIDNKNSKNINIYVDDLKAADYTLTDNQFSFVISVPKSQKITINIQSDFKYETNNGDDRDLCFILDSVEPALN